MFNAKSGIFRPVGQGKGNWASPAEPGLCPSNEKAVSRKRGGLSLVWEEGGLYFPTTVTLALSGIPASSRSSEGFSTITLVKESQSSKASSPMLVTDLPPSSDEMVSGPNGLDSNFCIVVLPLSTLSWCGVDDLSEVEHPFGGGLRCNRFSSRGVRLSRRDTNCPTGYGLVECSA